MLYSKWNSFPQHIGVSRKVSIGLGEAKERIHNVYSFCHAGNPSPIRAFEDNSNTVLASFFCDRVPSKLYSHSKRLQTLKNMDSFTSVSLLVCVREQDLALRIHSANLINASSSQYLGQTVKWNTVKQSFPGRHIHHHRGMSLVNSSVFTVM